MVELRAITEENFIDAFNLKLAPGQEEYVSHPIRSLAQAYVYRNQCQPFGNSGRVALTCNKQNPVARKLYENKGFRATGADDEDEIELASERFILSYSSPRPVTRWQQ